MRPDHLMPITERRNSELGHQRALEDPEAVLRDLAKIPHMEPIVTFWAMTKGLPVGRAQPGGEPFAYGLDGEPFQHELGPAAYPVVTELLRTSRSQVLPPPLGKRTRKAYNPYPIKGAMTIGPDGTARGVLYPTPVIEVVVVIVILIWKAFQPVRDGKRYDDRE